MEEKIRLMLNEGIDVKRSLASGFLPSIDKSARLVAACMKAGGKLLLCGNGGSSCDCSHVAGEFVGRFKKERRALPAIALTTDMAIITAIGNDYGFEHVFERQVEALGSRGDVLIILSTSGNSKNLINAVMKAREKGLKVISLLGKNGGLARGLADIEIIVPSVNTPRIQETHITILHIICELVEEELFG